MSDVNEVNQSLATTPIITSSLQEYLVKTFMETAEQELAFEIGGLGSTMLNVTNILTALNKITSVATYPLDVDQLDYKAKAAGNDFNAIKSTLWGVRSDIANGWDTLSTMLLNNEVPSGASDIITTIRDQPVGSTTFLNMVENIKATQLSTNYTDDDALMTDILSWYDGGAADSSDEKYWTTQTNLTNAVIEFEFINNTAQFQLRAAILVFQSFSDAAGSLLSKINKVIGDMINQIG
jgi:hypothetical protein